jgi:PEGA domain
VLSPIELHVLDGERVLGSSQDGPIMTRAGRHEFEFVNSVIGYRVRREVDVKAGEITALSVTLPNGTLNINATPWAAVWIDGTAYGETPLGNLSIVPGEHEIVFRHPQLGERRERIIVRPETPGRVAVNLQR